MGAKERPWLQPWVKHLETFSCFAIAPLQQNWTELDLYYHRVSEKVASGITEQLET